MIAVIDSGSGGANVINACKKYYNEDFVYLVDNKNCPYGNKSPQEVKNIVLKNIDYLIKNFDLDLIIIGCNTASALIDFDDMLELKIPILKTKPDMIALIKSKGIKILFATKNTIKNSNYVKYFLANYDDVRAIYVKGLPKDIDTKIATNSSKNEEKIAKKLKKCLFFNKKLKNTCNYMALGCTHFRFIKKEILQYFNDKIAFFECENQVAKLSKFLIRKNKTVSTYKVVLTQEDDNLKNEILKNLI